MDTNKIYTNPFNETFIYQKNIDRCIKYHKKPYRNEAWLSEYRELRKIDKRFVKVFSVNEEQRTLEMELIKEPFQTFSQLLQTRYKEKELLRFCLVEYMDIYQNMIKHAAEKREKTIIHHDFTLKNLVLINDKRVKVIDPDSVARINANEPYTFRTGKFLETFMLLSVALEFNNEY